MSQPKIELRLSDVEPPDPDPPRTIYRDVVNLPDPVLLGITIRYYNHDDVGLYFKIDAAGTGYTFTPVELGLLGSGANAYRNLDEFGSRARPGAGDFSAGEFQESIVLTLRAYTDAGYTNLKWTYQRTVTINWIKSDDAAFTVDELDNFDDGTVQGWAAALEYGVGNPPSLAVAVDYVLSVPYSLKMTTDGGGVAGEKRNRIYKSFTTANKPKVYAILDLRATPYAGANYLKYLVIRRDSTILIFLGRPGDAAAVEYMPRDKWMRIVTPLPTNTTLEIQAALHFYAGGVRISYLWLDDFKIISK